MPQDADLPARIRAELPDKLEMIGKAVSLSYIRAGEDGQEYEHTFETEVFVGLGDGVIVIVGEGIGPTLDFFIEG